MENQRNIILAVALAALVIIVSQLATDYFYPARPDTLTDERQTVGAKTSDQPEQMTMEAAEQVGLEQALAKGGRIPINAARVSGSINLTGARIDDLTLNDHRETVDKDSGPVRVLSPAGTPERYFAQFGWLGNGVETPTSDTVWSASGEELTGDSPVTLTWRNGDGQVFTIEFTIDDDYMISAKQTFGNGGSQNVAVSAIALINRTSENADDDTFQVHAGPLGVFNGSANFDWDYDDLVEAGRKGVDMGSSVGWLGFTDRYWLSALVPDNGVPVDATMRSMGDATFQTELRYEKQVVAPNRQTSETTRLFAGAKETQVLDAYEEAGVPLFSLAIDWGWFRWFEKPIFYLLDWLFRMIGNFGVAIICLTFIIRGLMFPIAQKGFKSMAAMRAIQPKMKAIQERYKDDKPKQQQEIMALYKTEKVNPLAGCLPMFLQIPVFFALYKVLVLTIEMRHQPFALWIKDLSAPDPLTPVNLFGLIPFDPPSFLALGVLPIILGVTMWLQFKLQPQAMDPVQQQVFSIMPWIMMFVMAPFAAGLQLYWAVSNILTIAQQKFLYSRHPQLKEQMKKDAEEKRRKREQEAAKG